MSDVERERQLFRMAFARMEREMRASQRAIEILANLFERSREMMYPEDASRAWSLLNSIPNLRRIPLYPELGEPHQSQHYRWYYDEPAFPYNQMEQELKAVEEFARILSGVPHDRII